MKKSSDFDTNLETAKMIAIVERWDRAADQRGDVEKRKELWTILYALDRVYLKRDKALLYLKGYKQTDEVVMVYNHILGGGNAIFQASHKDET